MNSFIDIESFDNCFANQLSHDDIAEIIAKHLLGASSLKRIFKISFWRILRAKRRILRSMNTLIEDLRNYSQGAQQ